MDNTTQSPAIEKVIRLIKNHFDIIYIPETERKRRQKSIYDTREPTLEDVVNNINNEMQNKIECISDTLLALKNGNVADTIDQINAMLSIFDEINNETNKDNTCKQLQSNFKFGNLNLVSDLFLKFVEHLLINFDGYQQQIKMHIFKNMSALSQHFGFLFRTTEMELTFNDMISELLLNIIQSPTTDHDYKDEIFCIVNLRSFKRQLAKNAKNKSKKREDQESIENNQSNLQGDKDECKLLKVFNDKHHNWVNNNDGIDWCSICNETNMLFYEKHNEHDIIIRCQKIIELVNEHDYSSIITMDGQGRLLFILCKQLELYIQQGKITDQGNMTIYFVEVNTWNHIWHSLFFPKFIVIGGLITLNIKNVYDNIFNGFMYSIGNCYPIDPSQNYENDMYFNDNGVIDFQDDCLMNLQFTTIKSEILAKSLVYLNFCGMGSSASVVSSLINQIKETSYRIMISADTSFSGSKLKFYELFSVFYNVVNCNNVFCRKIPSGCKYQMTNYNVTERGDFRTIILDSYSASKIIELGSNWNYDIHLNCENEICTLCDVIQLTSDEIQHELFEGNTILAGGFYQKYLKYLHKNKQILKFSLISK